MIDKQSEQKLQRLQRKLQDGAERIAQTLNDLGAEAIEQMVHFLSGADVTYDGEHFRINVQTGNLRRHTRLEYPVNGDPFSVGVFNNASYAESLSRGISGEDRKRALLASKSAKTSKAGRKYLSIPPSTGATGWWTVTEDSELADQPPRPFAHATAEAMKPRFLDRMSETLGEILDGN